MPTHIEIKTLTPKVFKFIEKIDEIEKHYQKRWTEIQKIAVTVKQNKRSIFDSEDQFSGDGTSLIPAWENIASLRSFVNETFYPMDGMLSRMYDELLNKQLDKLPSLKELIYKSAPGYHNKIEKISDMTALIINSEKALYPNALIIKNLSNIYTFVTNDSINYIDACRYHLNVVKNSLINIVSKEEELVEEDSLFLNKLVNSYLARRFLSEAEEDINNEPTPTMDDSNTIPTANDTSTEDLENSPDTEDNTIPEATATETIKPEPKELFDEDILNVLLYKLQLISVLYKSLSLTLEHTLVLLDRIIDLSSLRINDDEIEGPKPEDTMSSSTKEEFNNTSSMDNSDDDVVPPEGNEESMNSPEAETDNEMPEEPAEEPINTDVTEEDTSDTEF